MTDRLRITAWDIKKWRNRLMDKDWHQLQEEARIATHLQQSEGISRTEALKIAKSFLENSRFRRPS